MTTIGWNGLFFLTYWQFFVSLNMDQLRLSIAYELLVFVMTVCMVISNPHRDYGMGDLYPFLILAGEVARCSSSLGA